jgi:hypothetical protein
VLKEIMEDKITLNINNEVQTLDEQIAAFEGPDLGAMDL